MHAAPHHPFTHQTTRPTSMTWSLEPSTGRSSPPFTTSGRTRPDSRDARFAQKVHIGGRGCERFAQNGRLTAAGLDHPQLPACLFGHSLGSPHRFVKQKQNNKQTNKQTKNKNQTDTPQN